MNTNKQPNKGKGSSANKSAEINKQSSVLNKESMANRKQSLCTICPSKNSLSQNLTPAKSNRHTLDKKKRYELQNIQQCSTIKRQYKSAKSNQKNGTKCSSQPKTSKKGSFKKQQKKQAKNRQTTIKLKQKKQQPRQIKQIYEIYEMPQFPQTKQANRVQIVQSGNTHDSFMEDERLEMLKLQIRQDSERIQKLNKVRDEHLINELSFTQSALRAKHGHQIPHHIQDPQAHKQEWEQEQQYKSKVQQLKKSHALKLAEWRAEMDGLRVQLDAQKQHKKKLQSVVKEQQSAMAELRSQVTDKAKQMQSMQRQMMASRNKQDEHRWVSSAVQSLGTMGIASSTQTQTVPQTAPSDRGVIQQQMRVMSAKIQQLESHIGLLSAKLKDEQMDRRTIVRDASEVLQVVRREIQNISLDIGPQSSLALR